MATPPESIKLLNATVRRLAPTLAPQPLPRGVSRCDISLLERALGKEADKTLLQELVHEVRREHMQMDNEKDEINHFAVFGELSLVSGDFEITKAEFLTADEASIVNLSDFFTRVAAIETTDSEKEVRSVAKAFLKKNGHSEGATEVAQECVNAAYALQTIIRAIPKVRIVLSPTIASSTTGSSHSIDSRERVKRIVLKLLGFSAKDTKKAKFGEDGGDHDAKNTNKRRKRGRNNAENMQNGSQEAQEEQARDRKEDSKDGPKPKKSREEGESDTNLESNFTSKDSEGVPPQPKSGKRRGKRGGRNKKK